MSRWVAVTILIAAIFAVGLGSGYLYDTLKTRQQLADNVHEKSLLNEDLSPPAAELPEVSLTFAGDVTLTDTLKLNVKNKLDGDYGKIFGAATTILSEGQATFSNFAGTLAGTKSDKVDNAFSSALQKTGFTVMGTTYAGADLSVKSLVETTLTLDGNGVLHAGSGRDYNAAREPVMVQKNGVAIGYLAFTDSPKDWPLAGDTTAGLLSANDPQLEGIIADAKAKSDVLVVSFNWADATLDHTERASMLSRTAIDAGATIVVGHHGTNMQDIEYYHGGLIAYNLGTLIRGTGTRSKGVQGLILRAGIRGGVITTLRTYGVVENQNGFIDSVSEISPESLIRDKGVIKGGIRIPEDVVQVLPPSVAMKIVAHGPKKNAVAITIDDGWQPQLVKRALDILSEKNATATFFTIGETSDANKFNFIRAVTNGIELGNHSDTHGWLTQMTDKRIAQEMDDWQKHTDSALGFHYESHWFRPPFMAGFSGKTKTAESTTAIAASKGMRIALWDVDPFSGISLRADAESVAQFCVASAHPGSIILLHFTKEHMKALPAIIDGLRKKGYALMTLSDLMKN